MPDLEDDLRADGAAWREQVDGVRPDLAPRAVPTRTRAWVGGLVAAALVVGLAVVVLVLRDPQSPSGHSAAGADRAAPRVTVSGGPCPSPPCAMCRSGAICPTNGNRAYGSGFSFSLTRKANAAPTIQAAAAKFPPRNVHWTVAAQDASSALLLYRSHFLHLVRLPAGGWAVDSGGDCGNTDATVAR